MGPSRGRAFEELTLALTPQQALWLNMTQF